MPRDKNGLLDWNNHKIIEENIVEERARDLYGNIWCSIAEYNNDEMVKRSKIYILA